MIFSVYQRLRKDDKSDSSANPPINQPANPPVTSTPPQQSPASFQPNYDILSSLSSSRPPSQVLTSLPGFPGPPQPPLQQQQAKATASSVQTDPFASLISGSSRGSSPFPPATSQASSATTHTGGASVGAAAQRSTDDDEWNFTSSLPDSSVLPSSNKVVVLDSSLRIEFVARRHPSQPRQIHIVGLFSNRTSQQIVGIHFQVAVSKVGDVPFPFSQSIRDKYGQRSNLKCGNILT